MNESKTKVGAVIKKAQNLTEMLADVSVRKRFEQMLGNKAAGFMSSIIQVSRGNRQLQEADPASVVAAAAIAASLDLPIVSTLGHACIVPYRDGDRVVAQFQVMARGWVQLAWRSGQYKTLNAVEVYEGEIKNRNRLTGEMDFDPDGKKSDRVVGYLFYFKLLNGAEKYTYMTVEECHAHGKKYSKSYANPKGKWAQDFPSMALKTVVKQGLSKWGPMSIDMQKAVEFDQAAITPDEKPQYIDTTTEPTSGGGQVDGISEGKVPMPKPKELPPPSTPPADAERLDKGPGSGQPVDAEVPASATFKVASGATTDMNGHKVYVIRTDEETPRKVYTDREDISTAAKKAKADKAEMSLYIEEREAAGLKYLWATDFAKDL